MQIDLLSFTGHKMYGPKGSGAFFIRKRTEIAPLIVGGGQERGLRSGTLNVPGIVGLGKACAICRAEMTDEGERLRGAARSAARGTEEELRRRRRQRIARTSFAAQPARELRERGRRSRCSSASATSPCRRDRRARRPSATPSHVLVAIGAAGADDSASIRFGVTRFTTDEDIDYTIEKFTTVVRKLRETAPGGASHAIATAQ